MCSSLSSHQDFLHTLWCLSSFWELLLNIVPFWDSKFCSFKIHFSLSPLAGKKVKYQKSLCSASRIHPFLDSVSLEQHDWFQKMLWGILLHLHGNYACLSTLPASLMNWSTQQTQFRNMKTVHWVIRSLIVIGPSISNSASMALVNSTKGKNSW